MFHCILSLLVHNVNLGLDVLAELFLACLVTFVVAIGYEGLKYVRQVLHYRQVKEPDYGKDIR